MFQPLRYSNDLIIKRNCVPKIQRLRLEPHERWNNVRCVMSVIRIYYRIYWKLHTKNVRYFFLEIFIVERTLDFVDAYSVLYTCEEVVRKFIRRELYTYAFYRERSSDDSQTFSDSFILNYCYYEKLLCCIFIQINYFIFFRALRSTH